MEKLKCDICGALIDEKDAKVVKEDPSPAGVGLPGGYYEYLVCPLCEGDLTEVEICHRCQAREAKGSGYCEECECDIAKQFKIFVDLNMGDEDTVDARSRLIEFLAGE